MTQSPQNVYAPVPPANKRSARFFVYEPDVGWREIESKYCSDIYNGRVCIPDFAGKTYRTAHALVEIDGCKVVALCHMEISNWKFGDDGFISASDLSVPTRNYAGKNAPKPAHKPETIPTLEDIIAIKHCLGLGGG
jgi:hypothetical protein